MSNRLGNRTRLLGAGMNARVSQWLQRSLVKSVQAGTIAIANGAASGTATITAVVTANTRLLFGGMTLPGNTIPSEAYARLTLTDSTTVTATRNSTSANIATVAYTVVEYWPGVIRSSQFGTVDLSGGTSNTATITAVTVAKSEVVYLGYSTTDATSGDDTQFKLPRLTLTDATTVTGNTGQASATVGFQVVEWT